MNGDEYLMPGGLYDWEDDERTDVYLQESGPGINQAKGVPLTLCLRLVTGNGEFALVGSTPEKIIALGRWLIETAKDIKARQ